jgi:hypothetical protein
MKELIAGVLGAMIAVCVVASAEPAKHASATCDLREVSSRLADLELILARRPEPKDQIDAAALDRRLTSMEHVVWDIDGRTRAMATALITMSQPR